MSDNALQAMFNDPNDTSAEPEKELSNMAETPTALLEIQEATESLPPALTVPDGGVQAWFSVLGGYVAETPCIYMCALILLRTAIPVFLSV